MDGKRQVVWKKYCSFGIVCDCGTVSAPWSIDMAFRHGPSGVVWFWLELAFVISFFLSGGSSWLHLFFRRESPPYAACLMPMAVHRPYRMSEAPIRPSLLGQAWCPVLSATTHSDQVGTIHPRRADSAH